MGATAGALYLLLPYMGPALADSTMKEKEASSLTMKFSPNPALSSLEKDADQFRASKQ